jgi:arabinan endo-1,5-alpha-L-arabinosidase
MTAPTTYRNPVLDRDFPDPNVIRASDGWCYAYATQGLGERPVVNIQVARSRDVVTWEYLGEALPERPPWARTTQMLWAPHVVEHDGVFVMAYSAAPDDPPYQAPPDDPALCLGMAVAESPGGPFADVGAPLHCGPTTSDIDPAVFHDPAGGRWYCYWGSGGDIVVQELARDLRSFAAGSRPRLLLRGWSAEPKLPFEHGIEGPYVVERDGWYHLWYSGDRTWTYPPHYATMVARSRAPDGPFERRSDSAGHVVLHDSERWRGPGHNSVLRDDTGDDWVVYHAIDSRRPWLFDGQVRRVVLIDRVEYADGWPVVGDGSPSEGERSGPVLEP